MEYVRLGRSGLKVSRLCLGCMTYGNPTSGKHEWTLPEEQSRPLIKKAVEAGINFFDTANVYSAGTSEEILGRALRDFTRREEVVIATKVNGPMRSDANALGNSRKAIMTEIDNSLRRLNTDYVDLYQIHRWDYDTPIEETLEALHDVVKAGKARYIGASSMYAYQFARSLYLADRHGWTRFVSMQNHYNLLYREEEREMMRLCAEEGVGVIPWSPLARGRLTRDFDEQTFRTQTDAFAKKLHSNLGESDRAVAQAVADVASARGVPRAQVALSWVAHRSPVTAPIIGASKASHLDDAVAALSLKLTGEEVVQLESNYQPHAVLGLRAEAVA
jgi:aryl-alcohol dehydrogenase-like predicted oxidoreductase